jgi:hypothetical protein
VPPYRRRAESAVSLANSGALWPVTISPVVACQIDTKAAEFKAIEAGMEYLQGYRITRELTPEDAAEWISRRGGSEPGMLHGASCDSILTLTLARQMTIKLESPGFLKE